ncbi:hypothetical protein G9P44_005588 [Scheffersomyces stipitis]|nr:hypothetical protein G9P44_005588 [Scheffersomyces stipitis]
MSLSRHSLPVVIVRTALIAPFFIFGVLSIVFTQFVGAVIFKSSPANRQSVMNLTKNHFILLIGSIARLVCPCEISVTYDKETLPESDSFRVDSGRHLISSLTPNSVIISNHQIYTDWLFLWFLSYTARFSYYIHIILKDMSNIPVLGFGMTNYNFLFLSRKWEKDKIQLSNQLAVLDANSRGMGPASGVQLVATSATEGGIVKWPKGRRENQIFPYQLILFPEGTVPSVRTRGKSAEYIKFKDLPPLKHVLLPRVRGLYLSLRELRNSIEVVYDITTGYSGLVAGEIGEESFSLKRHFLKGYGPSRINFHIRGFKISEIPLGDSNIDIDDVPEEELQKFEDWLLKVWYEKDALMDGFFKHGRFVDPKDPENKEFFKNSVVADLKLRNPLEVFVPFTTVIAALLLLRLLYFFIRSSLGY